MFLKIIHLVSTKFWECIKSLISTETQHRYCKSKKTFCAIPFAWNFSCNLFWYLCWGTRSIKTKS